MMQSPSVLGIGLCTIAGAFLPFLADAATGVTSFDTFGRWVQAGGTVGMVAVLLWIRQEEKVRREKEMEAQAIKDKAQWDRYDKASTAGQDAYKALVEMSEKYSLRVGGMEETLRQLVVEVRLLNEADLERARKVLEQRRANG